MDEKTLIAAELPVKYMFLGRMQQDCKYYLGNGCRSPEQLYSKNEEEHIKLMKAIYNSLKDYERPEWLSISQIEYYEAKMTTGK